MHRFACASVPAEVYLAPFDNGRTLTHHDIEDLLADNLELPTISARLVPSGPSSLLSSGAAAAVAQQLYSERNVLENTAPASARTSTSGDQAPHTAPSAAGHRQLRLHKEQQQQQQQPPSGQYTPSCQQGSNILTYQQLPSSSLSQPPPWFSRLLRPASTSAILLRLLRNLREGYWVPALRKQVGG